MSGWAGLRFVNLATKAAMAAVKTAEELEGAVVDAQRLLAEAAAKTAELEGAVDKAQELAEAAAKTAEELEEVAVGFLIPEKLQKQDNLAPLPPKEHRTAFEQFIAERQNHPELKNEEEIHIHPVYAHDQLSYVGDIDTSLPRPRSWALGQPAPPSSAYDDKRYDGMEVTASTIPVMSSYHNNYSLASGMLDPAHWSIQAHNSIQYNVPGGHLGGMEMVQINNYLNDPGSKLSALSDASSQMVHVAPGGSGESSRLPKRHATACHGIVACKLERDQVREIFRMAILPMSMPLGKERKDALADVCQILLDKFKVSITTIKDIINRKTWRSVTIDLWTRDQRETFAAEHSTKRRGRPYKDTTIESLPKKDKDVKRNVGRPRKNPDPLLKLYEASCVGLKLALEVAGSDTYAPCTGPPA